MRFCGRVESMVVHDKTAVFYREVAFFGQRCGFQPFVVVSGLSHPF